MILLLGASGLLGSAIAEVLRCQNIAFTAPSRCELDVTRADQLRKYSAAYRPDMIIMCAAYTAVDRAESEPEKCYKLNTKSVQSLVDLHLPLIHFSTDYVFGVTEQKPILENAPRDPLSIYGRSKADAENLLEGSPTKWWNIRTSWLYGKNGKNFVDSILKKAQSGESLNVVDDQIGRPTYADDLARWVVKYFVQNTQVSGHYHLQNEGPSGSWYEIAQYACKKAGIDADITAIKSTDLHLAAARPKWSVLGNNKLSPMRNWQLAVDDYISHWPYPIKTTHCSIKKPI